jgi:TatD DNase family protein
MQPEFPPLVDIHTHGPESHEVMAVISLEAVSRETSLQGDARCSVGVHPWQTDCLDLGDRLLELERLCERPNVLAIGECGLDRLRGAALSVQTEVFTRQIRLAERLGKPLIVHCVRAFSELLGLKRKLRVSVPMIVHGFNQRERIGEQLLAEGFWLSFGRALLERRSAASALFPRVPEDRLFLETDDASLEIGAVYAAAAELRRAAPDALRTAIWINFRKIFLHE